MAFLLYKTAVVWLCDVFSPMRVRHVTQEFCPAVGKEKRMCRNPACNTLQIRIIPLAFQKTVF